MTDRHEKYLGIRICIQAFSVEALCDNFPSKLKFLKIDGMENPTTLNSTPPPERQQTCGLTFHLILAPSKSSNLTSMFGRMLAITMNERSESRRLRMARRALLGCLLLGESSARSTGFGKAHYYGTRRLQTVDDSIEESEDFNIFSDDLFRTPLGKAGKGTPPPVKVSTSDGKAGKGTTSSSVKGISSEGKAGKAGKAGKYGSTVTTSGQTVKCAYRPEPTVSPAPTKYKKTKAPTRSPAPTITPSPTKLKKEMKTKAPAVPTLVKAATTKYPYCPELTPSPSPEDDVANVLPPGLTPTDSQEADGETPTDSIDGGVETPTDSQDDADVDEPTDGSNGLSRCDAIGEGIAGTDYPMAQYKVDFTLKITRSKEGVIERFENFLQRDVAPELAGCPSLGSAQGESSSIQNVVFDVQDDTFEGMSQAKQYFGALCPGMSNLFLLLDSEIRCSSCANFDVVTDIYYTPGSDTSGYRGRLFDILTSKCDAIRMFVKGVDESLFPCKYIVVTAPDGSTTGGTIDIGDGTEPGDGIGDEISDDTGNSTDKETDPGPEVAGIQDDGVEDSGLSTFAAMVLAAGALVIVLFALLFTRQRRRATPYHLRHHKMVDDGFGDADAFGEDDSTYLQDTNSLHAHHLGRGGLDAEGGPSPDDTRMAHVVGENDSVVSGWSRSHFSSENQHDAAAYGFGGLGLVAGTNVHKCSSATCDVCEAQRQSGLQFVPTAMPSHSFENLPADLNDRKYLAEDTIQL